VIIFCVSLILIMQAMNNMVFNLAYHSDKLLLICSLPIRVRLISSTFSPCSNFSYCQALMEIYTMYRNNLSAKNICILFEALHGVALNAHKINSDTELCSKLEDFKSLTQMHDPPLLRLESETYQMCLTLVQNLALDRPPNYDEAKVESVLLNLCKEVIRQS